MKRTQNDRNRLVRPLHGPTAGGILPMANPREDEVSRSEDITAEAPMQITRTGAKLVVKAPAKLNLFLEVLGRRDDGYHDIESVFQTVSLFDEITLEPADAEIRFSTDSDDVPCDGTNLVVQTAELLRKHAGRQLGAVIELTKNIPVGAGMGGGSSDAAAALVALNQLWKLDLPREELHKIAEQIGSDVPFFLYGGTAVCRGRGERVEPIANVRALNTLVVYPGIEVSTRRVYENLPVTLTRDVCDIRLFLTKLIKQQGCQDPPQFFNRLEAVTVGLYESLNLLRRKMKESGLRNVIMTGSGSAFFGIIPDEKEVRRIAEELTQEDVGEVFIVRSIH